MSTPPEKRKHPLAWVPSLYFSMGLPNNAVAVSSVVMYKNLGYSNDVIALATSQIYLPWVLKPVWAPFLEPFLTKRRWVLAMQFLMVATIGAVALVLPLPEVFRLSLAFFWITGFASATQDIAADAVYLSTLGEKDQARYMGVQGVFWNAGSIVSAGTLVWFTGKLHDEQGFAWITAWTMMMGVVAGMMLLCALWHTRALPEGEPSRLKGKGVGAAWTALLETWGAFFRKDRILLMLVVCFFYRFGEGFIEKFGILFLQDPRAAGGLAFNNQAIGNLYNTVGQVGFIGGTFLGGFFAARFTLRRSFLWLALALNVPHLTYYLLSVWQPHNLTLIGGIVTLEKVGFGFGSVGHMLYMMQQMAPGNFKMSHYAFATGIMAGTKWFTGTISGFLFDAVHQNYQTFFLWVLVFSVVPIALAWIAPFPHAEEKRPPAPA